MEEKQQPAIEFYGGKKMAILPIVIYIFIGAVLAIGYQYYSMRGLVVAAFVGLIVGFLFVKNKSKYWDIVIGGLTQFGNAKLIFTFLLIGIFTRLLLTGDIGSGFIWLSVQLKVSGSLYVIFAFLASTIIAMGAGAPIAAVFSVVPIFYPPGVLLGAQPAVLIGALLSGVFFGDALSPSSQVINTTINTQHDAKTKEPADLGIVFRERTPILVATAICSMVLFFIFGNANVGDVQGNLQLVRELANVKGLFMLIPVTILLTISFKTKNLFLGLSFATLIGFVVGLVSGSFALSDIVALNPEHTQISGIIFDGMYSMVDITISTILLFGMIAVAVQGGVIQLACDHILNSKLLQSAKGAEIVIALGTGVVNVLLSGCVLPGILLFSNMADTIGQRKNISPNRRSYLMIGMATNITAIVPINSAFVMGIITIINEMGMEQSVDVTPFAIFASCYYCLLLTFVCIYWLFFKKEKVVDHMPNEKGWSQNGSSV